MTVLRLYETADALDVVREWIYENEEVLRANEGVFPDELAALLLDAHRRNSERRRAPDTHRHLSSSEPFLVFEDGCVRGELRRQARRKRRG